MLNSPRSLASMTTKSILPFVQSRTNASLPTLKYGAATSRQYQLYITQSTGLTSGESLRPRLEQLLVVEEDVDITRRQALFLLLLLAQLVVPIHALESFDLMDLEREDTGALGDVCGSTSVQLIFFISGNSRRK